MVGGLAFMLFTNSLPSCSRGALHTLHTSASAELMSVQVAHCQIVGSINWSLKHDSMGARTLAGAAGLAAQQAGAPPSLRAMFSLPRSLLPSFWNCDAKTTAPLSPTMARKRIVPNALPSLDVSLASKASSARRCKTPTMRPPLGPGPMKRICRPPPSASITYSLGPLPYSHLPMIFESETPAQTKASAEDPALPTVALPEFHSCQCWRFLLSRARACSACKSSRSCHSFVRFASSASLCASCKAWCLFCCSRRCALFVLGCASRSRRFTKAIRDACIPEEAWPPVPSSPPLLERMICSASIRLRWLTALRASSSLRLIWAASARLRSDGVKRL
mmetsp:Transcript_5659/g.15953  ORF Transcript_5659/g.15953 Transcript_5659/m.15953 type:complete len:334 (-) Transcript_5659:264-1265(-)